MQFAARMMHPMDRPYLDQIAGRTPETLCFTSCVQRHQYNGLVDLDSDAFRSLLYVASLRSCEVCLQLDRASRTSSSLIDPARCYSRPIVLEQGRKAVVVPYNGSH